MSRHFFVQKYPMLSNLWLIYENVLKKKRVCSEQLNFEKIKLKLEIQEHF